MRPSEEIQCQNKPCTASSGTYCSKCSHSMLNLLLFLSSVNWLKIKVAIKINQSVYSLYM